MISLICKFCKSLTLRNKSVQEWLLRSLVGKWKDIGQREQTFSYKINKFWKPNVRYSDYILFCILDIAKRT